MSRDVQLWTSVLTAPTAWFLSLLADFALDCCGGAAEK